MHIIMNAPCHISWRLITYHFSINSGTNRAFKPLFAAY
jgi:hypothetical protein